MIKGDLTRFSPGDLLTFLSHLNVEGVLTVNRGDQDLNIHFRSGGVAAASSDQADGKVLASLRDAGLVNAEQFAALDQARRETGLPLRRIIKDSGAVDLAAIEGPLVAGIHEVVFQLFTWDAGEFQFSEVSLDDLAEGPLCPCNGLALDAARQVDEYREFCRNVAAEDQVLAVTAEGRQAAADENVRAVLDLADGTRTVRQVVLDCPRTSFAAMKAVEQGLQRQWLAARTGASAPVAPPAEGADAGELYQSYKRTALKVLQAAGRQERITELIAYCRDHFDYFVLFSFAQGQVARCLRFQRDETGRRVGTELPGATCGLDADPTFRVVCESRAPFFGGAFDSPLLRGLGEPDPAGECAVIPLGGKGDRLHVLYVAAGAETRVPGPLHYLEMIAWQIHAPARDGQPATAPPAAPATPPAPAPADRADAAAAMVAAVNSLPPMPHVVSQAMDLLSDRDSRMSDLIEVLSRDPALVARLIRVSNSALYGRGEQTTSLKQAVVRLGANTVRSLVMAASMKALFPLDKTNVGVWGQTLWQHSVECGLASRRVAQVLGHHDPEGAFVAGVLHDIGKVVILLGRPEDYRQVLKRQASAKEGFTAAEQAVLGFDHTEVGQRLLAKWQMPESLQACVRHHHEPGAAGPDAVLARIVAVGDYLSRCCGGQPDADLAALSCDYERICAELGLPPERAQSLLDEMGACLENRELLV